MSPDGKLVAAANPNRIALVDLATGKARPLGNSLTPYFFDTNGAFVGFSPDSKLLVHITRGGNLRFWDVAADNPRKCNAACEDCSTI